MRDITKSFPGIRALEAVSSDCAHGEMHAICGENGAGKSTLIKVLGGIYQPDAGSILVEGRPAVFSHPVEARRAGISIIHSARAASCSSRCAAICSWCAGPSPPQSELRVRALLPIRRRTR